MSSIGLDRGVTSEAQRAGAEGTLRGAPGRRRVEGEESPEGPQRPAKSRGDGRARAFE